MNEVALLSKSRFMTGLECPRRLYLQCFQSELATRPNATQQARLDKGTRIGELARKLWPDGVYISEQFSEHPRAVELTRTEIERGNARPTFEGGSPKTEFGSGLIS